MYEMTSANLVLQYLWSTRRLQSLTFKSLAVSFRTKRFNIQNFYMALTLRLVFCTDLWPDSDFCFTHH